MAFGALLFLADLNIPKEDLSFFLPPIAFLQGLYLKDRWTAANMTGLPKSVLTTGFQLPILAVPAYESTVLSTAGGNDIYNGILAHKEWQALVRQIKLEMKQESSLSAKRAADTYFWQTYYGYGQIRSNHASRIIIKRSADSQ